eukprot:UC1_evm1s1091
MESSLTGLVTSYAEVVTFEARSTHGTNGGEGEAVAVAREFKCYGSVAPEDAPTARRLRSELRAVSESLEFMVHLGDTECPNVPVFNPPSLDTSTTTAAAATSASALLEGRERRLFFLEFWATWCRPCAAINECVAEITARRGAEWRASGACEFVALSIDQDPESLRAHLERTQGGAPHVTQ